jgi:hypothetical protein
MDHLVGPTDMGEDRQSFGFLVEQNRVVRGDRLAIVATDQDPPRVLSDQPTDHFGILCGVVRIVAHDHLFCHGPARNGRAIVDRI